MMNSRWRRCLTVMVTLLLTGATLGIVTAAKPAAAAITAPAIRGGNWADARDNFVCGDLVLSGLWPGESYATTYSKATAVYDQMVAVVGLNTVRLPLNVDTVTGAYWTSYYATIDAAVARGLNVILSQWDQCNSRDGRFDVGWQGLWDRVIARYGTNDRVLFEPMNEPHGYSASDWLNTVADWLVR